MTSVKLECSCGSVVGSVELSGSRQVHVVCHCGDCQTYARRIGNPHANQIVQLTPAQVQILVGKEHLRCLRLTERGLTRWFTACCRTPLANTSRHRWLPFVGVMQGVLDADDRMLGPPTPVNGQHPVPWRTMARSLRGLMLGLLLRRHRPHAFFDDQGAPIARPEIVA